MNILLGYLSLQSFLSWWEAYVSDVQWKVYHSAAKAVDKIQPLLSRYVHYFVVYLIIVSIDLICFIVCLDLWAYI